MNRNNYCVILAGGIGSRLWPTSRQRKPKQFIDFFGCGETLLQATYKRYSKFIDRQNIIVVSNMMYAGLVSEQLPDLPKENLLLEPMRRNTVPSVSWAAYEIIKRDVDACMVVTPADQMITNEELFISDVLKGLDYAARNRRLLTLGVQPTRPETAYGYIQMADEREEGIYKVQAFTEKPEEEFAKVFYENKEFLWNTGLFIWSAHAFLSAIHSAASYYSDMMVGIDRFLAQGAELRNLVDDVFSMVPNVPLEVGILEKVDNVDVMLCHFGWTDIGTWKSLYSVMPKDAADNVVLGSKALLDDCERCVVKLPSGRIAVVQGLKDYVIAEEDGVLVICKKDTPSDIRRFVNDVQMNIGDELV